MFAVVGVQKEGYTFSTPITVHGQSEPWAPPHQARQGRRARVRPKLKRTTTPRPRPRRAKGTKRTPPARSLPGDSSSSPGKTLAVVIRLAPTEKITLESTAPKGQGFGRHPHDGMQIFVKKYSQSDIEDDDPWRDPSRGRPQDPRQAPCRGRPQCHDKTLAAPPARPLPRTPAGPQPGPRLPRYHRRSHASASSPS